MTVEAQDRIHNLFEKCFEFMDFSSKRFTYDVRTFRPNENRDHVEFHLMGCADESNDFPINECRTYVVHVFPERDVIKCRVNITKMKDGIDLKTASEHLKQTKQQNKKKNKENFNTIIEHIDITHDVYDSPINSEEILGEHILVECRRRGIYFGWGDVP